MSQFPWPKATLKTSCVQCRKRATVDAVATELVNVNGEPRVTKWNAPGWIQIMRRLEGKYAGICAECNQAIDSGKRPMYAF